MGPEDLRPGAIRSARRAAAPFEPTMHTTHTLTVFLLTASLATHLTAQVQIPINPRATYLITNNDPASVPSPGIPLSALGTGPGQWLRIATTGAYSDGGGGDSNNNLVCVFSSSLTLLPTSPGVQNRVPGAIAAGPSMPTAVTYYGGQVTDIPQDFAVARDGWSNGILLQVPAGATHIFLAVNDANYSFYGNNADPNSDYFAVFTPSSAPTLPGTGEHCELRTGINGTPTATPDVKQANPFTTLGVEVRQMFGASTGELFVLGATTFPTGGAPPVGPLPNVHMGTGYLLVQVGVMTAQPGQWSLFVPPGYAGTSIALQGFFLSSTARNGLLSSSVAHRIELQ